MRSLDARTETRRETDARVIEGERPRARRVDDMSLARRLLATSHDAFFLQVASGLRDLDNAFSSARTSSSSTCHSCCGTLAPRTRNDAVRECHEGASRVSYELPEIIRPVALPHERIQAV